MSWSCCELLNQELKTIMEIPIASYGTERCSKLCVPGRWWGELQVAHTQGSPVYMYIASALNVRHVIRCLRSTSLRRSGRNS